MGIGHAHDANDIMCLAYVDAMMCDRLATGITDNDKIALGNLVSWNCTDDPVRASAHVHGSTAYVQVRGVPSSMQGLSVVFQSALRDGREYDRLEVPCGQGAPAAQSEWVRWDGAARPDSIVGIRRDGMTFWLPLEVIHEKP